MCPSCREGYIGAYKIRTQRLEHDVYLPGPDEPYFEVHGPVGVQEEESDGFLFQCPECDATYTQDELVDALVKIIEE